MLCVLIYECARVWGDKSGIGRKSCRTRTNYYQRFQARTHQYRASRCLGNLVAQQKTVIDADSQPVCQRLLHTHTHTESPLLPPGEGKGLAWKRRPRLPCCMTRCQSPGPSWPRRQRGGMSKRLPNTARTKLKPKLRAGSDQERFALRVSALDGAT